MRSYKYRVLRIKSTGSSGTATFRIETPSSFSTTGIFTLTSTFLNQFTVIKKLRENLTKKNYQKSFFPGSSVKKIGVTNLVSKQLPLHLHAGQVMSASSGGQLSQLNLTTHDTFLLGIDDDRDRSILEQNLGKQLALLRFPRAYDTCRLLKSSGHWRRFADVCLRHLEIEHALRGCTRAGDVATAWFLAEMLRVEDVRLLSGFVSMHLGELDRAQTWFLKSSGAMAALEMRCDLLQWEQALQLAKRMAPELVAYISKEYAQQLEFV